MASSLRRVVKLGGSLLELPRLPQLLRDWMARQSPMLNVMIAGGGNLVEALREYDRVHGLDAESAHWLAVEAMRISARLLRSLLPEFPLITECSQLDELASNLPAVILDPCPLLKGEHRQQVSGRLPIGWDVTSDSIAARAAYWTESAELVLLKSCLPPTGATVTRLAQSGYVDAYLPRAWTTGVLRCVNLRADGFPEQILDHGPS